MKKNDKSVHGNAVIPMQITAILIPRDKFLAFFAKCSGGAKVCDARGKHSSCYLSLPEVPAD